MDDRKSGCNLVLCGGDCRYGALVIEPRGEGGSDLCDGEGKPRIEASSQLLGGSMVGAGQCEREVPRSECGAGEPSVQSVRLQEDQATESQAFAVLIACQAVGWVAG